MSFTELVDMMGLPVSAMKEMDVDYDKDCDYLKEMSKMVEFQETVIKLCQAMTSEGEILINTVIPCWSLATEIKITAPGINEAAELAVKVFTTPKLEKEIKNLHEEFAYLQE